MKRIVVWDSSDGEKRWIVDERGSRRVKVKGKVQGVSARGVFAQGALVAAPVGAAR